MRALKHFAIALTPFILNAELVKIPEIQEPSILLNTEHYKVIQLQEMPSTAPVVIEVEKPAAPIAQETPAPTNHQEAVVPVAAEIEKPAAPVVQEAPAPAPTNHQEAVVPVATEIEKPAAPVATNNDSCLSPFHVMHVDVRHTESKGVGYKDGYTTLEGFGIYDHNPYFMPFLDLRGHVFNDGRLAGNIGLGERTVIPSINHIFGLYLYYDVRQEDHGLTVNQLSPGIEMLGKRMEYRINAYFPVGDAESHRYQYKFNRFQGNRIIVQNKKKFAMTGVDGEVGAHITQTTRHDFYFGIGPYYFTADPNNAWGGKTRLYWRYKDYVSLEASYSYDHIFKNIVQGTVAFSYPFGAKLKRTGRNCPNANDLALSRAAFAPYRFEIPVVETRKQHRAAVNPATGQPWRVWFVRNTSSSNGTAESPFSTLVAAQNASGPSDMIYVFQGDGTTRGMDTGITLKNGQTLFGSGNSHEIRTTKGQIRIPAFTPRAPSLTNAGSIITLANGNEVSGMNLLVTQVGSNAIDGTGSINSANINQNIISGSVIHLGIHIDGFGTLSILDNSLTGPTVVGFNRGIAIGLLDNTFSNVNVANNTISGYDWGINVEPHTTPTSASANILISGNTVSNFTTFGIIHRLGSPNQTLRIINNAINNTSGIVGSGAIVIQASQTPNTGRIFVDNNTILTTTTNTGVLGIISEINIATSARFSITNNNVQTGSGAGSIGINVNTVAGGTICTTLTNNRVQLQAAGTNGMSITTAGSGVINIDDFSNNIAPSVVMSGNVNLVPQNTCGQ